MSAPLTITLIVASNDRDQVRVGPLTRVRQVFTDRTAEDIAIGRVLETSPSGEYPI